MTDSMNFGPEWLRNLSSDGSTGGGTGGVRYQLAEYRYGREDMLALYDKTLRPPNSLCSFTTLYSEQPLPPLAFQTSASEDDRVWQSRAPPVGASRGRGGSLERGGGRGNRGRGTYQPYGRSSGGFETGGGWGNSEQSDWSPRKDYNARSSSVDNWRRSRGDEDDGWRSNSTRISEKWGRQTSWRDGDANEERGPGQERNRGWHDGSRASMQRRTWDDENLPEWANENLGEGGGTFDASGAFHGSDDELVDSRPPESDKKESPLQKSSSQHNIQVKKHPALLPSSKSSASLSKPMDSKKREMESPDNNVKEPPESKQFGHKESKQKKAVDPMKEHVRDDCELVMQNESNGISSDTSISNRVDEDFDRLQEDLVLKIVEEPSKLSHVNNASQMDVSMSSQPPPNLAPPVQDKWYYQDPQGDLQGPFSSSEMAEWFRAGYFTVSLLVRRQCDERFYMLGDLVTLCNGNPFQTSLRIAPLKNENPNDLLKVQIMQQLGMRQAPARVYPPNEAWRGMPNIAQRDMLPQQLLPQPPQQIPPVDLSFISAPNPLLALFQMHQAKAVPEKTPNTIATDPLQAFVQQMGGLQSLENRLPTNVGLPANAAIPPPSVLSAGNNVLPVTNNIQGGNANLTNSTLTGIGLPGNLQGDTLPTAMPGLHNPIPPNNMPMQNLQNLPGGLPSNLQNSLPPKTSHAKGDNLNDNNAIKNLLRQIATQSQPQQPSRDALWQQNQFVPPQINSQWQQQSQQQPPPPDVPISMWDMQLPPLETALPLSSNAVTPSEDTAKPKEPIKPKETKDNKEEKKKKEIEEKAAKKESEEKRKQEQRKQEAEKKAAEEKRKRDEERIKKELEKARKEAEEKRLRELEEKRKLKEQRKAEEEAKKKAEELKKLEEQEKKEAKEKEEQLKKQMEAAAKHENQIKMPKAAPWCQSNNAHGTSLAEIQKAEREKRAQEAALVQKVKQEQETIVEKPSNTQFSWANKPIAPRQVKSLAEIQAEEQEKLAKQQVSEARLAQQQKEKEIPIAVNQSIWNGQNLTWANNTSQWSNAGFWDGTISEKVANNKPATGQKTTTATAVVTNQQQQQKQVQKQPVKNKVVKKEPETVKTLNNNNNSVNDEFINWCTKSLTALKTTVDIPTFVNFLRDIESALDVREYCRDYLGDSPATHQFAAQFLEKRRSFKPKVNAHKDDMCTPAPAITPSSHSDFQEVKSKGKKTKKSKMLKVDSRILGFNVTASHDRINVGDRDYVDN